MMKFLFLQGRIHAAASCVHPTCGPYRTIEELWDGEVWVGHNTLGFQAAVVIVCYLVLFFCGFCFAG